MSARAVLAAFPQLRHESTVSVRRCAAIALALLVALGAVPACRRAAPAPPPPYNLVLVSLDTVRQDVLGCYGHRPRHAPDQPITPVLDQLARDGVRMVDAYSSSAWTLPAHVSLMTGLPALVHGVEDESGVLAENVPTLAALLRDHGYRTAGVYSAPYLDPHWGFDRGFDDYVPVYGAEASAASARAEAMRAAIAAAAAAGDWARYDDLKRQQVAVESELNRASERVVSSDEVAATAVASIERLSRAGRPWFVFAHFFDAHCDYVPPPPYDTRFDPDYTGSFTGAHCMGGPEVGTPDPDRPGGLIRRLADRDLEHAFALYEGEVAWVDAHVGTILDALRRAGVAERTLVVVVSDHGEEFFEHGGLGHRRTLSEEVVRVPMLLRLPGVLPAGTAVRGPVSLADVLPTVLEVLGIAPAPLPGSASFLPLVRGAPAADRELALRTVIMFGGEVRVDGTHTLPVRNVVVQDGFRRGAIKITRTRSWPQFPTGLSADLAAILRPAADAEYRREDLRWIDLARDPAEPADRASTDFADPAARAALDAFRRAYEELRRRTEYRPSSPLPQNVRRQLESLGYVEPLSEDAADTGGPAFPEPDIVLPPPGAP